MLPESVSEATVLSWTKLVGESVERDEVLIELETEKIVLEVPAPQSGQVGRIMKGEGSVTVEGDILGVIETGKTVSRPQPAEPAATQKSRTGSATGSQNRTRKTRTDFESSSSPRCSRAQN